MANMANNESKDSGPGGVLRRDVMGGFTPIPDPTVLTTAQLDRSVSNLEMRVMSRLDAMDKAADLVHDDFTRVPTAIDRAISGIKILLENKIEAVIGTVKEKWNSVEHQFNERDIRFNTAITESKTAISAALTAESEKIAGLVSVVDEKFASVARQFIERDVRTEQAAIATKIAVDAALQAQKEAAGAQNESNTAAITKSEAATVKQIDGISALLNSNVNALNDKIADIKGRLDRGEGINYQERDQVNITRGSNTNIIAMVACGIAALAVVVSVVLSLTPHLSH
jgi:hypothetical protein